MKIPPLAALALVAGCAGASRSDLRTAATPEGTLFRQRMAVLGAARSGNQERLLEYFLDSATLVLPSGATVRGRDAIAALLSAERGDALGADLGFAPAEYELCEDGAMERGGEYTILLRREGSVDTVRGRYALLWGQTVSGEYRVRTLVLGSPQGPAPRVRGCRRSVIAMFRRRSVALAALPPFGLIAGSPRTSFNDGLQSRGYRSDDFFAGATGFQGSSKSEPLMLALSIHVLSPLIVELVGHPAPRLFHVTASDPATNSWAAGDYRGRVFAALLGTEWRGIRAGVGPALARHEWTLRDMAFHFSPGGAIVWDRLPTDTSYTKQAVGLAVQLGYSLPVTPWFFLEARGLALVLPSEETPSLIGFPGFRVTHSGYRATVGVGLAF